MKVRSAFIFMMILVVQVAQAQQVFSPDYMRSIGKIYVVAGVTLIILLTLLIYMITLDRKISKLEKRQKHE
ncbi:MAG: CcmD family protein [Saprospiraceae bacterium]|uniref:CcmD family protein n=1 Tax=Candidatus Opimibacter skivensis TaxID=2982028 RepID=A0A9D7XRP3_9BACT|nr:CcmD family protein [Candidatus Opimibacter skivensis]